MLYDKCRIRKVVKFVKYKHKYCGGNRKIVKNVKEKTHVQQINGMLKKRKRKN